MTSSVVAFLLSLASALLPLLVAWLDRKMKATEVDPEAELDATLLTLIEELDGGTARPEVAFAEHDRALAAEGLIRPPVGAPHVRPSEAELRAVALAFLR